MTFTKMPQGERAAESLNKAAAAKDESDVEELNVKVRKARFERRLLCMSQRVSQPTNTRNKTDFPLIFLPVRKPRKRHSLGLSCL